MAKLVLLLFICLCGGSFTAKDILAEPSGPRVVVSIKPLHSLVSGVMDGVASPQLLVQGGGSPHGYVLRPSEARALSRADLIIRVGSQLETFLNRPLATLGKDARQVELMELLEPDLLPFRQQDAWEQHEHLDAEDEHAGEGAKNPHFWLDPLLAKQVVVWIADILVEIDPGKEQQYRTNAEQLSARLEALDRRLREQLVPVKDIPYIVFHDAYQYFETAYGLNAVASVAVDPERKPGARRIREIQTQIAHLQVRCVFSEPQFEPRLIDTLLEGSGAVSGVLDPLGAELSAGPESYFLLMEQLAQDLRHCLQ